MKKNGARAEGASPALRSFLERPSSLRAPLSLALFKEIQEMSRSRLGAMCGNREAIVQVAVVKW